MTNEELDRARVDEAMRLWDGSKGSLSVIAARLAREGWTPPEPVYSDLAEAEKLREGWEDGAIDEIIDVALAAIQRGRELERQEAKPEMVWVKHDGSDVCPVSVAEEVLIQYNGGQRSHKVMASMISWENVTHYAIISQPEEK